MLDWSVVPVKLLGEWFSHIASQNEINKLAAIANFVRLSDNEKIERGIEFLEAKAAAATALVAAADAENAAKKAAWNATIAACTSAIAALEEMVTEEE